MERRKTYGFLSGETSKCNLGGERLCITMLQTLFLFTKYRSCHC